MVVLSFLFVNISHGISYFAGTHCLETPPAPSGFTLLSAPNNIPVNEYAQYACANGKKFETDPEQAYVERQCLVEDTWSQEEFGNCVESKSFGPEMSAVYVKIENLVVVKPLKSSILSSTYS